MWIFMPFFWLKLLKIVLKMMIKNLRAVVIASVVKSILALNETTRDNFTP